VVVGVEDGREAGRIVVAWRIGRKVIELYVLVRGGECWEESGLHPG
jgi:hypothetical protein